RWSLALLLLLPLGGRLLRAHGPVWPYWRRFALLGLLGVGSYNSLQYLALKTSTPINVTLVAGGTPVWMMAIGWLWFGQKLSARQLAGAALSIAGVLLVLCRGDLAKLLAVRLLPGDLFMLLATIVWAMYSWLLTRPKVPEEVRADWSGFLVAQMLFGLGWSGLFTAAEWSLGSPQIVWGWPLAGALLFVAIGPSIIAYRCWGVGVHSVGPTIAAFFSNLTPLFAAVMSAVLLGEVPHLYHAAAFALIVGGIVVSSRRS
ncbi:MAG: DMT family transporter, partial [Burkholderiales bacterium]